MYKVMGSIPAPGKKKEGREGRKEDRPLQTSRLGPHLAWKERLLRR